MNRPFFTVITPCLNAGSKLNLTMDSILGQTFHDYEVIVKDGGSTDGSIEALPADRRIRLICQKDSGIYDAMNEAVASAGGEYLYFLNCGDTLHDPDVLGRVEKAIEQDGPRAGIYYGDVVELRTGQHVAANPHMSHFAMFRNLPCHQACFYNRDMFSERAFDVQYRVRADYEHFLWCVIRRNAAVKALSLIIADYEGGGFSETAENRKVSEREHREITEAYFNRKELRLFRAYRVLTLQPVRAKLAESPKTAGVYDRIKNALYKRGE